MVAYAHAHTVGAGVVMTERMAMIKAQDEAKWTQAMGVGEGCVRRKSARDSVMME